MSGQRTLERVAVGIAEPGNDAAEFHLMGAHDVTVGASLLAICKHINSHEPPTLYRQPDVAGPAIGQQDFAGE